MTAREFLVVLTFYLCNEMYIFICYLHYLCLLMNCIFCTLAVRVKHVSSATEMQWIVRQLYNMSAGAMVVRVLLSCVSRLWLDTVKSWRECQFSTYSINNFSQSQKWKSAVISLFICHICSHVSVLLILSCCGNFVWRSWENVQWIQFVFC